MNASFPVVSALKTHRCAARVSTSSAVQCCSVCGICLDEGREDVYLRPDSLNHINFLVGDPVQILKNMVARQEVHRFYNTDLSCKEERLLIIEWMESLAAMLEFSSSTFHTACAILDVLMTLTTIEPANLKMIAYVCVNLAGKMEEPCKKLPTLASIAQLFQGSFTVDQFAHCEQVVFSMLGCSLSVMTPFNFATHFAFRGALSSSEVPHGSSAKAMGDFEELMDYFLRATLDCYELYQYSALAVGAAVIACVRKHMGLAVFWPENLAALTGVSWTAIKGCCGLLDQHAQSSSAEKLTATDFGASLSPVGKDHDSVAQTNSPGNSLVTTEFECVASDDDDLFGESQTVVLKFSV